MRVDQKKKTNGKANFSLKPVLGKHKLFQCVNPKAKKKEGEKLVRWPNIMAK